MQIACVKDYLNQTTKTGDEIKPLTGPKGDLIIIELEKPGNYVAVRPSGTEPKIKFYMFTCLPPEESQDVDAGVAVLQSRLDAMESDLRAVIE
jgi:phosphoglucomutase/phosphomannomutase